jgi:hypothetical protein
VAVLGRLVRLSYWDRVMGTLPEAFRVLMPPKPEPATLPEPDAPAGSGDEEGRWAARMLQLVSRPGSGGGLGRGCPEAAWPGGWTAASRASGRAALVGVGPPF